MKSVDVVLGSDKEFMFDLGANQLWLDIIFLSS